VCVCVCVSDRVVAVLLGSCYICKWKSVWPGGAEWKDDISRTRQQRVHLSRSGARSHCVRSASHQWGHVPPSFTGEYISHSLPTSCQLTSTVSAVLYYNKWSRQFDIRPHRRRTWTVHSYSPGGANLHPIYRKPKMVDMAPSLRTSKSAMSYCLHRIVWPRKPTRRIKQHVAGYHTTEVIAHPEPKSGCHGNIVRCKVSAISAFCRPTTQNPRP